ncbi:hypothetical protein H0H87_005656 [Tephrocybe sp. NHM501043]|nr:hypothetical protein H0H87_005656 [Tephrocybe sp. NHM501043]
MADQYLLDILQAHGEQFLHSFSLPNAKLEPKKRKRTQYVITPNKSQKIDVTSSSDNFDEWGGIDEADFANDSSNGGGSNAEPSGSEFEVDDDEFTAASSYDNSNVVVFHDIARSSTPFNSTTKSQMKAFMDVSSVTKKDKAEEEKDDERHVSQLSVNMITDHFLCSTNAQNDAILHRLIHTKLLSGSLNPDLDMTPAHRRKALAGRVLELSGTAKLGKGEKSVREMERNKASKRVRDGLKEKQKARARQELEQAKDLGNYHPTLKKLFDDSDGPSNKKRERGLRMGVGKFRGGLLQLGREDVQKVMSAGGTSRGRSESRGGRGRGRGRGR